MGGAKKVKLSAEPIVYHHTSTLSTNLIWMSGIVEIEGRQQAPLHPELGEVQFDPRFRRDFVDFPPVAWFTTELSVPKCLLQQSLCLLNKETGEVTEVRLSEREARALSLHRVALGFRASEIGVIPWPEYHGFKTAEGKELNETAIECGDDPTTWYISEQPVDLAFLTEIRLARSRDDLKMLRNDKYLRDIQNLLARLKVKKAYIPPTWMSLEQATALAWRLGLKMG